MLLTCLIGVLCLSYQCAEVCTDPHFVLFHNVSVLFGYINNNPQIYFLTIHLENVKSRRVVDYSFTLDFRKLAVDPQMELIDRKDCPLFIVHFTHRRATKQLYGKCEL